MAAKRRRFTAQFKAKVVMEAFRGDRTIEEIAARHHVHPSQVSGWKRQAQEGLEQIFGAAAKRGPTDQEALIRDLQAKVDDLTVERDFLSRGLNR